jgi:RNA polymerase sigma-70 factor (ECF subfamily)
LAYTPVIAATARSFDPSPAFADDVQQKVHEILFVGTPKGGPRIAQYRGQGTLASWVRITARRAALRLSRTPDAVVFVGEEALATEIADSCDQELALMRETHREFFRRALSTALKNLPKQQRRFLQLNFVAGISMERIGKMYGLSQSSVSRKIRRAMIETLDGVKRSIRDHLGLADQELDSFLASVRSQLDFQLSISEDRTEAGENDSKRGGN